MSPNEECLDYFRNKTGFRHGALFNGASSAFHAFLLSQGFPKGSEILFPVECYPTLPMMAIEAGLVPRFVDVDENLNLCPDDLQRAMSARVRCLVVIHMAGYPARMTEIENVIAASENPAAIILEDLCQAFGTLLKGGIRKSRSVRAAILSFSAGKLISVDGGGLLLSDEPDLINEAGVIGNNGYCREARFRRTGYSYGMHPAQIAALARALPGVESILESREVRIASMRRTLEDSPFATMPLPGRIHEHKIMARFKSGEPDASGAEGLDRYFDVGEGHYPIKVYEEGFFKAYLDERPDYGPLPAFPKFESEINRYFAFRPNVNPERFREFLDFAGGLTVTRA